MRTDELLKNLSRSASQEIYSYGREICVTAHTKAFHLFRPEAKISSQIFLAQ
jgi:hypothetical protein